MGRCDAVGENLREIGPKNCVNVQELNIYTVKQTAGRLSVLGEGIFTMGYSKNYNVLGGFYMYYSTTEFSKSVHKVHESCNFFL
jgi:hypothetical protein